MDNKLWHNLDPMHIEKNFCDNFLGTLLDIAGNSKYYVKSCYDLHQMGIHKELQLIEDDNSGNFHLAKAFFTMKLEEKRLFCTILKDAKLVCNKYIKSSTTKCGENIRIQKL